MIRKAGIAIASKKRKIARPIRVSVTGASREGPAAGRCEGAPPFKEGSIQVLRDGLEHARRPGLGELVDRRPRGLHEGGAVGLDRLHLMLVSRSLQVLSISVLERSSPNFAA